MAVIPMEESIVINIQPEIIADDESGENNGENECNICLDVIEDGELIENICSCRNAKYHKDCIKRWIETKKGDNITCEICKSEYRGIKIKQKLPINISKKAQFIASLMSIAYITLSIYYTAASSCNGCEAPIGFMIIWTLPYFFVIIASIVDRKMHIHTMCMMMTTSMNPNSYIRNVIVFEDDVEADEEAHLEVEINGIEGGVENNGNVGE